MGTVGDSWGQGTRDKVTSPSITTLLGSDAWGQGHGDSWGQGARDKATSPFITPPLGPNRV